MTVPNLFKKGLAISTQEALMTDATYYCLILSLLGVWFVNQIIVIHWSLISIIAVINGAHLVNLTWYNTLITLLFIDGGFAREEPKYFTPVVVSCSLSHWWVAICPFVARKSSLVIACSM